MDRAVPGSSRGQHIVLCCVVVVLCWPRRFTTICSVFIHPGVSRVPADLMQT